jgi:hypothetical protein
MTTTPVGPQDPMGFDPESTELTEFLSKTKSNNNKPIETGSSAVATKAEVNAVIADIVKSKNLTLDKQTYTKVLCTVAHMVQDGATSPKQADSKKITEYGLELKVGDLRASCKKNNITVRKLARGIRKPVIEVATAFQLEGNLAKSYKLQYPDYDDQELIWVSDFQTFSKDPSMPDRVKKWLLDNYNNRFHSKEN